MNWRELEGNERKGVQEFEWEVEREESGLGE